MATIAVIGTANMRCRLATGNRTIVATDTTTVYLRMIHRAIGNGSPGGREFLMTGLAQITTVDVVGGFSTGGTAVVTIDAVVYKSRMIGRRQQGKPGTGLVADITFVLRHCMICTFTPGQ